MKIQRANHLRGKITVPGDKSISHRAMMLGALAEGDTVITGFLRSADCMATMNAFQAMGIEIEEKNAEFLVHGKGLHGLTEAKNVLQMENSGTTTRLLAGILAGQDFTSVLDGDASLRKRPMGRVIQPLSEMGASFSPLHHAEETLPLTITGAVLSPITYTSPVASAQVKSAILLAALYADGQTKVTEPHLSRDHSERMLAGFGVTVDSNKNPDGSVTHSMEGGQTLHAQDIRVPGDISSAAYWIAAGLLVPDSEILIQNCGINETRDGILRVAKRMGGSVEIQNKHLEGGEPVADLLVRTSRLQGTEIGGAEIPTLIDELPVIAVMASLADGTTVIQDAGELRVKESDRLFAIAENLRKMGVVVDEADDGMVIEGTGGHSLQAATIDPLSDHRLAMAFSIAGLLANGTTEILNNTCVAVSYPDFYVDLEKLF